MTRRTLLLLGTAAAALFAGRAGAQAFQGNHAVAAGAAARIVTSPSSETIRVDSPSAILTWTPSDSAIGGPAIDFLPAGNVATFTNGPNNADFMVLNRIVPKDPSRAIQLNGTVIGQLKTAAGTSRGGTIAFYSPGGILIGSKAVVDVGSLLLTTIDPKTDNLGNFFVAGSYSLTGAVDPKSFVSIAAGAQIGALNEGSYVAVAAPVVQQHGTVSVNGTAAYVAAEAVTLTINGGLFDIQVVTGSSSASSTLVHDGTTGGPASSGAGDDHRIYMVAVPKNAAITALLEGNVGFAAASSAAVQNGEIVLSAGRSVTSGDAFKPAAPTPGASFLIRGGTFTSDVLGTALSDFVVDSADGNTRFGGNLSLTGDLKARIDPAPGRSVDVAGNLVLRSDGTPQTRSPGIDNVGGDAGISAAGASVTVGGNATLSAIGLGGFESSGQTAGNGTGGIAGVAASAGGTVAISGNLKADASGTGGSGASPSLSGGKGAGGAATLSADSGTVSVGGATSLIAAGTGGGNSAAADGAASGTGGSAGISAGANGVVKLTGAAILFANGTGGTVSDMGSGAGGAGQGGSAGIRAVAGSVALAAGGSLSASGTGSAGPVGGTGTGGQAFAESALGGKLTLGGTTILAADGQGGAATFAGGDGGAGTGGLAQVVGHNGAGSLVSGGSVSVSADGSGGAGAGGNADVPTGGKGGTGTGGTARLLAEADSGAIALDTASAHANGFGGAGGANGGAGAAGTGGAAAGGIVDAGTVTANPGNAIAGSATFGTLSLDARAAGGSGGAGGNAAGGTIDLFSRGAPVAVTATALLDASATASGGTANGGTLNIGATKDAFGDGPGSLDVAALAGVADAVAGGGSDNRPGAWHVLADGGHAQFGSLALGAASTGSPAVRPASDFTLKAGTVAVTGAGTATSGGDLAVAAAGSGRLKGGNLALAAPSGAISVSHAARPAAVATIDAANLSATSSGAFAASPGTRMTTSGTLSVTAGGAIQLDQALAAGPLVASTPLAIVVTDNVAGRDMTLRSSDIVFGPVGSLGTAATNGILLDIAGNGRAAVVGGGASGGLGGYTLDASEMARVRTAQLNVLAPAVSGDPASEGDVYLRDMTLSGTDAGGGLARFALSTPGRVQVDGRVTYANAAPGDTLALNAGERIQVLTPGGALLMSDAGGRPGGTLSLAARDIWAGDAASLAHLQFDPAASDLASTLVANRTGLNPQGSFQAGGAAFTVSNGLFVQNSGTLSDVAGITVGAGGLTIRGVTPAPIDVIAFGRRVNPDGSVTGNLAFYAMVDYGKSLGTRYTARSEFNRCNINAGCPPPAGPPLPPPAVDPGPGQQPNPPGLPPPPVVVLPPAPPVPPPLPRQAALFPDIRTAAYLTGPLFVPQLLPADMAWIIDEAFVTDPLIEEPVTSGGDSSLWAGGATRKRRDE